jgi:RNA polymerase sigma-70 factor (ECF subfamily)
VQVSSIADVARSRSFDTDPNHIGEREGTVMKSPVTTELIRSAGSLARPEPVMGAADAALMAAFVRQEDDAARQLYDRFASRIYGLGLVLLRSKSDAEDLVQDTFLKVWRTGSAFDPVRGSLDVWILLNARGIAIDLLRRRTLEGRKLSSLPRLSEASDEAGPERQAEVRDLFRRANDAMGRLSSGQRSALELTYLGQRSTREIAEMQGIPRGTVKSRVHAAVASLQKAFPEDDDAA